jgi:hypothetical protein
VLLEEQEFDQSIDCFQKLCHADPTHTDGRAELAKAKQAKKNYLED